MADEMIRDRPMMTEPIMIPSAVFWSSSISLRSEKGSTALMIRKLIPNRISPMNEKMTLERICLTRSPAMVLLLRPWPNLSGGSTPRD